MALPQDGQDANGLTKVTQIPAGKELMFIDPTTNEGGIITLEDLTKQILNGLTSQTFGLDSGTQTLPAAINYLYGNMLKPFHKGIINNTLVTVPLVPGLYLVSTYRDGGYKISSLSIVNIQTQNGSFIETLVKGVDYDNTIEMKYTNSNISFQYKISLSGGCTIVIFKLA
jgi:hypothetical protein